MENRLPVGPGSRGGHIHDPAWRRAYGRAWRWANPEYRERERLRMARRRAAAQGRDPAEVSAPSGRTRPLPLPAEFCACDCSCREPVVAVCGFCRDGMHGGHDGD